MNKFYLLLSLFTLGIAAAENYAIPENDSRFTMMRIEACIKNASPEIKNLGEEYKKYLKEASELRKEHIACELIKDSVFRAYEIERIDTAMTLNTSKIVLNRAQLNNLKLKIKNSCKQQIFLESKNFNYEQAVDNVLESFSSDEESEEQLSDKQ